MSLVSSSDSGTIHLSSSAYLDCKWLGWMCSDSPRLTALVSLWSAASAATSLSLYHILLQPCLLLGLFHISDVFKSSWSISNENLPPLLTPIWPLLKKSQAPDWPRCSPQSEKASAKKARLVDPTASVSCRNNFEPIEKAHFWWQWNVMRNGTYKNNDCNL